MESRMPLRVTEAPILGEGVLQMSYGPRRVPAVPPTELDVLLTALMDIHEELIAIRADLKARSIGGRWTRFVAWMKGLWRL